MTPLILISATAASASTALLSAIWQSAILTLCVALCLRLLPGISAAVRSALWTAVFAIAVVLPFIPAPHLSTPPVHALHAAPIWSVALALIWLALSLFRAARFVLSALRLRQIARRAAPIQLESPSAPFTALLSHAMSGDETSRRYTLCTSPDVDRPSVLGFFHPRILLPPGLLETLTPAELEQVLLHETEHLRRSDDWTNLLQKLALVLFPLNPVLLWVEHRLCLERELACDDRVLSSTGSRKAYATTLAHVAERGLVRRSLTLALAAFSRQSELSLRVHRILARPTQLLSPARMRLAAAALLLAVTAAAVPLARTPRFISFAPAATQLLAITTNAPAGTPIISSETWDTSAPKAILVKAAMPASLPTHTIHAAALRYPRTSGLSLSRRSTGSVQSREQAVRNLAVNSTEDPRPITQDAHRVLTITYRYEEVQSFPAVARVPVAYAAFATPDGWIIFQL